MIQVSGIWLRRGTWRQACTTEDGNRAGRKESDGSGPLDLISRLGLEIAGEPLPDGVLDRALEL